MPYLDIERFLGQVVDFSQEEQQFGVKIDPHNLWADLLLFIIILCHLQENMSLLLE